MKNGQLPPLITVVVPSFQQGQFLDDALNSIFSQDVPIEVFVMDGGSTDNSLNIIQNKASGLAGWRSHPDNGQAAAINEGMSLGSAPYVCWLNSDDIFLPFGLDKMLAELEAHPEASMVYAKSWHIDTDGKKTSPYITFPFNKYLFANYCFISQPSTLIRRKNWESVGGLDPSLKFALDYDLWWKLESTGEVIYLRDFCAANREHEQTKTQNNLKQHYMESIAVVRKYFGYVPLKWRIAYPAMKLLRQSKARHYKKQRK